LGSTLGTWPGRLSEEARALLRLLRDLPVVGELHRAGVDDRLAQKGVDLGVRWLVVEGEDVDEPERGE